MSDQDLVTAFLGDVDLLSGHEVEDYFEGVTQSDVSRWQRGDYKRLSKRKRRAIQEHVHNRQELEGFLRYHLVADRLRAEGFSNPYDPRRRQEIARRARELADEVEAEGGVDYARLNPRRTPAEVREDWELVEDPEAPDIEARALMNEDFCRRLLGRLGPGDRRSKLAVLQYAEEKFVERNQAIPPWVEALKREHGLAG